MLKILLVDAGEVFRIGVKSVIRSEYRDVVIGEASTAAEAAQSLTKHAWSLVILDPNLGGRDGILFSRETPEFESPSPVLVAGQYGGARAFRLGAAGYVSRNVNRAELLKAIQNVLHGKKHFTAAILGGRVPDSESLHAKLSPQELKVMRALARGIRVADIASAMNLSVKTVSTYKRRILNKMSCASIADLVRYVVDRNVG
jgi:two-component system invasion response regulator UvrY